MAITPTGDETPFSEGIRIGKLQEELEPINLLTVGTDGIPTKTPDSQYAHIDGAETFEGAKSFDGGMGISNFLNIYCDIDFRNDSDQSFFFKNLIGEEIHAFRSVKSNPEGNKANGIYLQNTVTGKTLNVSDDGNLYYDGVIIANKGDKYNIFGEKTSLTSVLFYGDSVTEGAVSTSTPKRWTSLVSAKNIFTETNLGIGGTTMNLLYAGDNSFTDRLPSIPVYNGTQRNIFVAYGINDYLQDWTAGQFETALNNALDYLITTKNYPLYSIIVVTPSIIGTVGSKNNAGLKPFAEAAIKSAKSRGVGYVDTYNYMLDNGGSSLISGDNIHPTDAGHAVIAEAINYKYFGNILARGELRASKRLVSDGLFVANGKSEVYNEFASINVADNSRLNVYTIDGTPTIQGATADNTTVKKLALNRFGGAVLVGTDTDNGSGASLQVNGLATFDQFRYTRSIDVSTTDFNDLKTAGFYNGASMAHPPIVGDWYHIEVQRYSGNDNFVKQTATAFGTDPGVITPGRIFSRVFYGGTTWSAWKEILTGASGSYTPTLTPNTNVTSATVTNASYTKIGNIVTGTIGVQVIPTVIGLTTVFDFDFPDFARATTTTINIGVTNFTYSGGVQPAITQSTATNSGTVVFYAGASTVHTGTINFQYSVLD